MKGFAPLLIIIIALAILGAGIGGYLYFSKSGETPASEILPEAIKVLE